MRSYTTLNLCHTHVAFFLSHPLQSGTRPLNSQPTLRTSSLLLLEFIKVVLSVQITVHQSLPFFASSVHFLPRLLASSSSSLSFQSISTLCVKTMDPSNPEKQQEPEEPRLLDFPHLSDDAINADGKPALNKYSSTITKNHDFPGAQVSHCRVSFKKSLLTSPRLCSTPLAYLIGNR